MFINGLAGERFAVRNSGAVAVVEGVGDHGCEYMTGGAVVVIGRTGRNFAAGMSGGVAYVLDEHQLFDTLCNLDMVDLESIYQEEDQRVLRDLIGRHYEWTGSVQARRILDNWQEMSGKFVKVMPIDYRKALERLREREGRPRRADAGHRRSVSEKSEIRECGVDSWNGDTGWPIPPDFCNIPRVEIEHRPIEERIQDWHEIDRPLVDRVLNEQAARCMDCGIPFCHAVGCPVKNRIPEFNDLVYRDRWREAAENLHSTNNFPEITGRVCPAPCEAACTLALNDEAVNIKQIEYQIAERAFAEDWVEPLAAEGEDRQEGGRDRLRAGRFGRRAAIGPRRARSRRLREGRPARRTACATASPTSSWKNTSSTAGWNKWSPRA